MNILISNDDGRNAYGIRLLLSTVRKVWRDAKIISITPSNPTHGMGMSISEYDGNSLKELPVIDGVERFELDATPADVVYYAFENAARFLNRGSWDMFFSGVNNGKNTGFDIFHSGTVGQAIIAASHFRCFASAISQDLGNRPISSFSKATEKDFPFADGVLLDFLKGIRPDPGLLYNVNIPATAPKGIRSTNVAHYSGYRTPSTDILPRAKNEDSDIIHLADGYVTVSPVHVRYVPNLKW